MKTTVLKASKKLAEDIAENLLLYKKNNGKPIFRRREIESGFEIFGYKLNADKQYCEDVVFIYTNNPAPKIQYNEKILTL